MSRNFVCYNCGQANDHISRNCNVLRQQFTRCAECGNVAHSPAQHRIDCSSIQFISMKVGSYELPLLDFHNVCFRFKNVDQIFSAEKTTMGLKHFLITKFTSIGTNIRVCRTYGQSEFIIEVKLKPAITLGLGRYQKKGHMASLMLCNDQVRVNHHQHIDKNGVVSYNLASNPKQNESHDIDLRLVSKERIIWFTICWNKTWTANIAMTEAAFTIGRSNTTNQNE